MAEEAAGKVPRYNRNLKSEAHFRTNRESVSSFVADVALKNSLDMEKTVQELRPGLPANQIAETAQTLQSDPNVKAAIEKALSKRGLDEASKGHFVSILWKFAESTNVNDEKKTLAAWRILGRGFIADQVVVDKPETLPLRNLDEGLRRMGLLDDPAANMAAKPADLEDESAFDA